MKYNQLMQLLGEGSFETCQLVEFLKGSGSSEKFWLKYYSKVTFGLSYHSQVVEN